MENVYHKNLHVLKNVLVLMHVNKIIRFVFLNVIKIIIHLIINVKKIVKKKVRCTKGQTALLSMTPSHVVECADCSQEGSCQEGVRSRSLQIISIACGLRRVARGTWHVTCGMFFLTIAASSL